MEARSGWGKSIRLLVALGNILLGLTLLVAFGWAALRIYHAVLIFILGILLAYALDPLVTGLRRLARGRISRGTGVFLVLMGFLILITVVVTAAAGPTGRQLHELEARAPELRARADRLAASTDQWLAQRHIPFRVANGAQRLLALAHQRSQALVSEALHAAGLVAVGLVDSLLVLLVAIYLLIYSPELKQRLSKHVPPLYQEHFHGLRRDMNQILGGFIRGQLVMGACVGVAIGISCALLRLPFSILIGLFVAMMSLIPVVGAYLGALPAVLLALLDPVNPVPRLIWVIVIFFVVNEFGSKVLYPRLVGSATGLHEIVVLFVLLAGAEVGGVIGALLAVPLTALFGLLALYAYRIWSQSGRPGEPMPSPPAIDAAAPHEGLPSRPPELLASRRESEIES